MARLANALVGMRCNRIASRKSEAVTDRPTLLGCVDKALLRRHASALSMGRRQLVQGKQNDLQFPRKFPHLGPVQSLLHADIGQ
jgi:hypothetical protein